MTRSKIRTSGAEGLTLSSTSLTVANGLTLTDGDVTLASGHGIDFSATSDGSGSMSSELFDDYEEGTFTPTFQSINLSGTTFTSQTGKYVKAGRLVLCNVAIVVGSGLDTSDNSGVTVRDFPFTIDDTTESGLVTLGREVDLLNGKEDTFRNARFTSISVLLMEGDGDNIQYLNCSSSGTLQLSVMYMATA